MDFEYIQMSSAEEAEKYFTEKGHWIVANVRQYVGWPEAKVIIYFRGVPILLIPEETDKYPAVAILCRSGIDQDKAREIIHHFLSSWAWSRSSVIEIEAWGGGGRPYVYGRPKNVRMLSKPFRIMYLPDAIEPETRLALALYREAMALENPAYGFLSFYKVINLKYPTGKTAQKNWVEQALPRVDLWEGKKRYEELLKALGSNKEIAEYLYHSCRCAIAHADINQTTVNPENYVDMARLRSDLPLIRALVELLIEEEFRILREGTVYKKHPYELFGFKTILGEGVIKEIKNDNPVTGVPFPQEISIRLWSSGIFGLFEGMKIVNLGIQKGLLIIEAISSNNMMAAVLVLDFNQERILFDPQTSIRSTKDDGSVAWIETDLDIQRFLRRYWLNGVFELWDSKHNKCLGFSDAFVPVNIDLSRTIENFDMGIKRCEKEVEKRRMAQCDQPKIKQGESRGHTT
ncbi:MAG: hypothetical protein JNN05_04755 [Candidatus Omnitrophica bacterium]|nr:hypothetical protein [Candidatus Omnitrophota bacterium]